MPFACLRSLYRSFSFAPPRLVHFPLKTHGLRRGLYSLAASGLKGWDRAPLFSEGSSRPTVSTRVLKKPCKIRSLNDSMARRILNIRQPDVRPAARPAACWTGPNAASSGRFPRKKAAFGGKLEARRIAAEGAILPWFRKQQFQLEFPDRADFP
jgi:hypothetical protein